MFNLIFPALEQAEIYAYYDKISVENENKILLQKMYWWMQSNGMKRINNMGLLFVFIRDNLW